MAIGWREWIALPDLGIARLKAKIDTGAKTSALHATNIELHETEDGTTVSFTVPGKTRKSSIRCTAPMVDLRGIKNTSGTSEDRIVIQTTLLLGHRQWHIEVSLADRANMKHGIILGRTALRNHRIAVHADKSFLTGEPGSKPKKTLKPKRKKKPKPSATETDQGEEE